MNNSTDSLIEVGVVAGTHGLRGDLKIRTLPTGDLALPGARQVFLKDDAHGMTCCKVVRIAPHKQHLLLRLAEYGNIDVAKTLLGRSVWMARDELPELPNTQHYWHDLQGLEVVDRRLGTLGPVVGMFSTPAHNILEVEGPAGEILIPAVSQFIDQVDIATGRLLVNLPDGLVAESDTDDADNQD